MLGIQVDTCLQTNGFVTNKTTQYFTKPIKFIKKNTSKICHNMLTFSTTKTNKELGQQLIIF